MSDDDEYLIDQDQNPIENEEFSFILSGWPRKLYHSTLKLLNNCLFGLLSKHFCRLQVGHPRFYARGDSKTGLQSPVKCGNRMGHIKFSLIKH